jgi:quercetin dioxygenase-like cupin family protein
MIIALFYLSLKMMYFSEPPIINVKGNSCVNLEPKVIQLGSGESGYVRLLGGAPDSISMRAGVVTLQPGTCVGNHSTEDREEILVILEGNGTFILENGKQLEMKVNAVLYCPPHTGHDVKNTGTTPLRYVYVVAKVD